MYCCVEEGKQELEHETETEPVGVGSELLVQAFSVLAISYYALFSSKIFCKMDTVALSFVFDKYCPIID